MQRFYWACEHHKYAATDDPMLKQRATLPYLYILQILRKPAIYTQHFCINLPNAATVGTLAYTCLPQERRQCVEGDRRVVLVAHVGTTYSAVDSQGCQTVASNAFGEGARKCLKNMLAVCGGACTIGYLSLAVTFDDERIVGLADVRLAQDLSARR